MMVCQAAEERRQKATAQQEADAAQARATELEQQVLHTLSLYTQIAMESGMSSLTCLRVLPGLSV